MAVGGQRCACRYWGSRFRERMEDGLSAAKPIAKSSTGSAGNSAHLRVNFRARRKPFLATPLFVTAHIHCVTLSAAHAPHLGWEEEHGKTCGSTVDCPRLGKENSPARFTG